MSKLTLLFGILLIGISIPILLTGVLNPQGSFIATAVETIACQLPEKLVTETNSYAMPNGEFGQTTRFYCEIEPGQQRDVTDSAFVILGASFVIPFGLGIILTIGGSRALARRRANSFQHNMTDYIESFQQDYGSPKPVVNVHRTSRQEIPPEAQEILSNLLGGVISSATGGLSNISLSGRLTQLEDAYKKNLITPEEYEKVRQAILDSMDD